MLNFFWDTKALLNNYSHKEYDTKEPYHLNSWSLFWNMKLILCVIIYKIVVSSAYVCEVEPVSLKSVVTLQASLGEEQT